MLANLGRKICSNVVMSGCLVSEDKLEKHQEQNKKNDLDDKGRERNETKFVEKECVDRRCVTLDWRPHRPLFIWKTVHEEV